MQMTKNYVCNFIEHRLWKPQQSLRQINHNPQPKPNINNLHVYYIGSEQQIFVISHYFMALSRI